MDEELLEEKEESKKPGFGLGVFIGVLGAAAACLITLLILFHTGVLLRSSAAAEGSSLSATAEAKISAIKGLIELNYLGEIDAEAEEEGLYKGLVSSLGDQYSEYFTASEYEDQMQDVTKQYYGIGVTLTQDSETMEVTVVNIYEGTPAERAGLRVGDKVISADGHEAVTMTLDELVDFIHGDEGTTVRLIISREGEEEPLTLDITREQVNLPTIRYDMLEDNIGYIYLSRFAANTPEEFEEAVTDLNAQGMKALIIDVRYNPGGILPSVVQILDDILPEGTVVYTEDKYGERKDETSDAEHFMELPIAVLISGDSASASEILAGAIRDFHYGTVIGTTTYGKGVVQKTFPMTDGSAVKLTAEEYFTPSGENIHGIGIDPDIEIEYEFLGGEDDEYSYEFDNQIQKAVEVLKEQL